VKNRKHPAMARVMDTFAKCPLLATADVEQPCRNIGFWPIRDVPTHGNDVCL